MATNFPGPYELRFQYSSQNVSPGGVQDHEMRLNVDLNGDPAAGLDFDQYQVVDKLGAFVDLDVVVDDWLAAILPLFNTGCSFSVVELWKYPTAQSFDATYWATYTPSPAAGTSGGTSNTAGQAMWTFRTQEGGILKINLMESVISTAQKRLYSAQSAAEKAVNDYVVGGGATYAAVFLARDTSYPVAGIALYPGQNEALFKKRYRS